MLFKKETRTISKNGGFIIPVQIRRALGIYSRTQVDIEESKDPDVMLLIKTRPHCICCGKVGNTLVNVDRDSVNPKNSRFVCAECIESLSNALAQGETVGYQQNKKDVIDNYNINLHRIEEIEKENAEYEKQIQQLGLPIFLQEQSLLVKVKEAKFKIENKR